MKKVIVVVAIILILGGFVIFQKLQIKNSPTGTNVPTATGSSSRSISYKDGTYTGSVADATYGNIQVSVTIQRGKITDIKFLQYPNTAGHSTEVSSVALPILKQEAITAQNAKVDGVSGATQTSQGFIQTLQSALDQAKV